MSTSDNQDEISPKEQNAEIASENSETALSKIRDNDKEVEVKIEQETEELNKSLGDPEKYIKHRLQNRCDNFMM